MAGSSFGKQFRITNWGESHGEAIGVVVDGCPSLVELSEEELQLELARRAPGQSDITTPRRELDKVKILSGVFRGKTTGTPISLIIWNSDKKSEDYHQLEKVFRPSHADFTYQSKYGIRDPFGGGRSSARVTAGHVAAGAIAKKILQQECGIQITGYVKKIHAMEIQIDPLAVTRKAVESNPVRCPDSGIAEKMINLIRQAQEQGDSVGGVVECVIRNVPAGWGEPVFDKIDADLGKAMMGINAVKGFEVGSGFRCAQMYGSQHNDPFVNENGRIVTKTNNAGGIVGGITNGMPILFRVAFKPTSTINKIQQTVDMEGRPVEIEATGRHDPCVVPRAVPIVEAMAALVLVNHYLLNKAIQGQK